VNVLADSSQIEVWADALAGQADWDKVFAGFNATVDYPGAFFYKELLAAYPEAKVVLSVGTAVRVPGKAGAGRSAATSE
jgi:hypothetical protein